MSKTVSSHSSLAETRSFSFNRKRIALLVGLGLLTVFLLLRLGGGQEALAVLGEADWRLVLLAGLIHYSGFAVRGHRWQRLLAGMGHRLSYRYTTSLLLGGWFVSALLPARAGDVARVGVLRLEGQSHPPVPVADGLSSIVLERTLDITAILALGAGFGFAVLRGRLPVWVSTAYALGVGLLLLFGLGLLLAPAFLNHLRRLSGQKVWQSGLDFAAQLVRSLRSLLRRPGTGLLLVLESAYIWICDALLLWLVVMALGQRLPFASAAFTVLTADVFATVPLTPGAVGQIELAYSALLSLLSLPVVVVPAAVLLTRAISYWSFLLFSGAITFMAGLGTLFTQGLADREPGQ